MKPEEFPSAAGIHRWEDLAKGIGAELRLLPGGERETPLRGTTVRRYFLPIDHHQRRLPRPLLMTAIFLFSRGRLTPNDYYDLPPLPERAARALEPAGAE